MNKNLPDNQSNFPLHTGNDGKVNVEVFLKDENIWLTQKAIDDLFDKERSVIIKHLKKKFASGELEKKSNVQKTHFGHSHKPLKFYNLNISVGYRVNSYQAMQFRIWVTRTLKKYITKDFVLNDERLNQGNQVFGKDSFDKISTNCAQIHTLQKLRNMLLSKLMSSEVRVDI